LFDDRTNALQVVDQLVKLLGWQPCTGFEVVGALEAASHKHVTCDA
jgi:hypothetical protein